MADTESQQNAEETAESTEGEEEIEGGGEKQKEEEEPQLPDVDKYEPEVRAKPWNTRQERAEYFKGKQKEVVKDDEEQVGEEDVDRPITRKELQDFLNPLSESFRDQSDVAEITSFLAKPEHSAFKKYESLARKEAKVYQNVPIAKIFKSLAYDEAMRMGAEQAKVADQKATRNRTSGSATRKAPAGVPDFKSMSEKEFQAYQSRVMRGEKIEIEE